MYKQKLHTRITALILTVLMLFGMVTPAIALDYGGDGVSAVTEDAYTDDQSVSVSIVLQDAPTIS